MNFEYPIIISALTSVFGEEPSDSDGQALANMMSNLQIPSFKAALIAEIDAANKDTTLSWQQLLQNCRISEIDSEEVAVSIAQQLLSELVAVGS